MFEGVILSAVNVTKLITKDARKVTYFRVLEIKSIEFVFTVTIVFIPNSYTVS